MTVTMLAGDALEQLRGLPDAVFQTIVTSPPYFGLRSYLPAGHPQKHLEIGAEDTPDAYINRLVAVFREARRTLRPDGTLWVNIGDSYAANPGQSGEGRMASDGYERQGRVARGRAAYRGTDIKPKDLLGIPWMLAFALRADGWWLRRDIIWSKPNAMPESVTDRPASAHEYLFLLSAAPRYFYDADAIAEPLACPDAADGTRTFGGKRGGHNPKTGQRLHRRTYDAAPERGRNARSVWTIPTRPFAEAHFATMTPDVAERCVAAGSSRITSST